MKFGKGANAAKSQTSGAWDLTALLNAADPRAPLPERHLWLVRLLEWLRHRADTAREATQTPLPVLRLRHLLNLLDRHDAYRARVAEMLERFWREIDVASLFADFGYGMRMSLWGELRHRLALHVLPGTPATNDLSKLFALLFPEPGDADWLRSIDDDTLQRLARLFTRGSSATAHETVPTEGRAGPPAQANTDWSAPLADAAAFLATSISASGFSTPLRLRMDPQCLVEAPFHQLARATDRVLDAVRAHDTDAALQALNYLRALLNACRAAADSIAGHLEEHGVSVDIVFEVEQLKSRTWRLDELLACLVSREPARDLACVLADLAAQAQRRRSVRALFAQHYSMLARKVAERSAETGEHYITRDRAGYLAMLRKALGGGGAIAFSVFIKFFIAALGLSAFWAGLWAGVNYASCFVIVHLMHWTVATKQPAMTAPAMAARLADVHSDRAVVGFVDEVVHLLRSQAAGIFGNLAAVVPVVLALQWLSQAVFGTALISRPTAEHTLHSLTLLGPTALYAAFTGVLLFASSLIAGWAENVFVYHQLESAIAWNPRVVGWLGNARAQRWSHWWRNNISGLTANVSLGLMLGLVPAVLSFFGVPLDVRHVTLATGQIAAALSTLGPDLLRDPSFWWCVAAIPFIGTLNLVVSFVLALRVAMRSRGIRVTERALLYAALRRRLWRAPLSFLWPPK